MNPAMSMNNTGIQSLGPMLASMGSYEDKEIAHVAKGEVVVPKQLMDSNPELRSAVMSAFDEVGVDPAQFVVGGDVVMRNPVTGIQEFGLFKKLKKLVKKLTPVLVPLALNIVAPGIYSTLGSVGFGAVSGGLTKAIDGANLREVLEGAATGGAIGGIAQFASNQMTNQKGGYFKGRTATAADQAAADKAAEEAQRKVMADAGIKIPEAPTVQGVTPPAPTGTASAPLTIADVGTQLPSGTYENVPMVDITQNPLSAKQLSPAQTEVAKSAALASEAAAAGQAAREASLAQATQPALVTGIEQLGTKAITLAVEDPLKAYGYYNIYRGVTTEDEVEGYDEEEYNKWLAEYEASIPDYGMLPQTYAAARQGVATLRAGGAVNGPGTGTSDSIPAYLSDGEFVMTAKAVEGAGDGDRKKGAAKMYAMMDQFERNA